MIFAKWESNIFADIITITLGRILSGIFAFLKFNFLMILLICSTLAKGVSFCFLIWPLYCLC